MNEIPSYTYVFRRISKEEGCQAQVIVINRRKRTSYKKLRKLLESTTHYPAKDFEEVHQEIDTAMVLDTWEPFIETLFPSGMDFPAVRTYRKWWKPKVLTPTGVY